MKKLLIVAWVLPLLWVIGCEKEPSTGPAAMTPDEQVVANCQAVQAAAQAFAAENSGVFPTRLGQRSGAGHTLIDLLPGGARLENPYTGLFALPKMGKAVFPGDTGYFAYCGVEAIATGYLITGYGEDREIMTLSNVPPGMFGLDDLTIENCRLVQAAAEAFAAENNGEYPENAGADETPLGNTLVDFLPGGRLLVNPRTLAATDPVDGAAANPGETGYLTVRGGGVAFSYVITGYGKCSELVTLAPDTPENESVRAGCYTLRQAAEAFAAQNGGVYPDNVDVDTTPGGDSVIDLIGRFLWNPYTTQNSEPRNGPATSRGEMGYEPYHEGGPNIGYTITGWGWQGEIIRFEKRPGN